MSLASKLNATAFHQLIDRYISEIAPKHKGAYSEIKRLEALKRHPLATRIVATLTSSDFARYRDERLKIRKGNTVKRELASYNSAISVSSSRLTLQASQKPLKRLFLTGRFPDDERLYLLSTTEHVHNDL